MTLAVKLAFAMMVALAVNHNSYAEQPWLSTQESLEAFRSQVESLKPEITKYPHVRTVDRVIQLEGRDIDIRIYDADDRAVKPTIFYVHGACWVAGSLDSHDEVSRYLAAKGDVRVIAVDYRLGPENRFPSAHHDVYETALWLWDHSTELGIDKSKFAISGESAGAYFAAATALRATDNKNTPAFSFLLTVYAALDGGGSSWTECKDKYFEDSQNRNTRYGSPLWASNLNGMPPTYSIFAEQEISRAEQQLFNYKLREQRVQVVSYMHVGVGHDVVNWAMVKGDLVAHEKAVEFIRRGFLEAAASD